MALILPTFRRAENTMGLGGGSLGFGVGPRRLRAMVLTDEGGLDE
jgi:hypothetical protein